MASAATEAAKSALGGYQAVGSDTALESANQKYDVGGSQTRLSALKGIVGNLQSSVEAVDPSVTGRTSGTFTTEGQRQALVAKERAPILGDLNKQQSAYSSEQGDLTQKQTLASQMASALINDDKAKYQRLLDQYNSSVAQDTAEEQKRQFEASRAEQQRQFDITRAENARQFNVSSAQSAAKSAAANTDPTATFTGAFSSWLKGQGATPSRQDQDKFINSLFNNYGIKSNDARQVVWDAINAQFRRTSDPTKDWTWRR